ncbi:hypothetical protein JXA48_00380 [Candidatus Woesearchaeota archaeon]|nr:hypothetical protein [Candidatus Woesearchaeota archaeon]
MRHSLIVTLVVFFAIFSLVQTGMTIYYASQVSTSPLLTGNALQDQGYVNLCINTPPVLDFPCNTTLVEDIYYECQLNGTDADGDNLTYSAALHNGTLFYDLNSTSGLFSAIPTNDDSFQDNVTMRFVVNDDSGCSLDGDFIDVTFTFVATNDAPVYLPRLNLIPPPGPFKLKDGVTTRGIYLNNYFSDPDGDPLNFSSSFISPEFNIMILPSSEIILSANDCGSGQVFLRATDPYGLYAESDLIVIELECAPQTPDGGGGGAAPPRERCVPEWSCEDWGICYVNGTQKRKCTDVNGCDSEPKYFWRECDYIEQCVNGVQDYWIPGYELNEEGVDCGGPCPPCETCYDGIKNNLEEETDCGGPNCEPCMSCFDGIQNYGEDGVDCGGYCDPCPSCFDGVKNQDETGVDCGGTCPACRRLETPDSLGDVGRSILVILIPLAMLLLVAGVTYRIFRKQINAFIAKILWMLVRSKKKQILLSSEEKDSLLSMIADMQKRYSYSSDVSSNYPYQSAIARALRQFFDFILSKHTTRSGGTLARINKLSASKQIKSILEDYYNHLQVIESSKPLSFESLNLSLELFRQLVIDVGPTKKQDIARPVHEVDSFDGQDLVHVIQLLYNSVLALQFEEINIARKKYIEALEIYSRLSDSDQEKTYDVLHLTFKNISYVSSYAL